MNDDLAVAVEETAAVTEATVEVETPKSNPFATVAKELTGSYIVNSSGFSKLKPEKQTAVLAEAGSKPVQFVKDFVSLRNSKELVEKLLDGVDISMELEFNDIQLSPEEEAAVASFKPILAKLKSLRPAYPFSDRPEDGTLLIAQGSRVGNGSYYLTKSEAQRYWARANRYWAGLTKTAPGRIYDRTSSNGNNYVSISKSSISIGCQTIQRWQVEELAERLGWDFPAGK